MTSPEPVNPRIAPGDRGETGWMVWVVDRVAGMASGTQGLNLFRTMGKHPVLFRNWLRFAGRLMPGGKLPRRDTELVILRVAHLAGCSYEFEHHARMSRRHGVSAEDLERVTAKVSEGWPARQQSMLAAVDAMHIDHDLSDEDWLHLRTHLSEKECIELCLLAGHYEMLATFIRVLRIQPDLRRTKRARLRSAG